MDWEHLSVLGSVWIKAKPCAILQLQIGCADAKVLLEFKRPTLMEWTFPSVWYTQRNKPAELESFAHSIMEWEARVPRMEERGVKDIQEPQSYRQVELMGRVLRGALVMPRVALAWCSLCLRKRVAELHVLLHSIPNLMYHAVNVCESQAYGRCKEQRIFAKDEAHSLQAWQRAVLQDMVQMEKAQKKHRESITVVEARWSSFSTFISHLFDQISSCQDLTSCETTLYAIHNTTGFYTFRPIYQVYALYECLEPLVNRMEEARYRKKM